jgi:phosphoglycerate dehydrogenase-like enzyme
MIDPPFVSERSSGPAGRADGAGIIEEAGALSMPRRVGGHGGPFVGLGPIGTEMARLGAGLDMRLLGWTRRASAQRAPHGVTLVSLEDLFAAAAVVTLHLAYTPESHGLISRALLERMKPGAWFVNTARARLVDNEALVDLLRAARLRGAALDVHDTEPPPADYVFQTLPNVLITPHIGYNTAEAASNMLRIAVAIVEAFARGERLHVVNGV